MITLQLVMRLGKPMEHLQAALRASASDSSPVETLLLIARHIGYFAFLSYDAIAWVCHFVCSGQLTYLCVLGTRS
jgi:peroxin-11B